MPQNPSCPRRGCLAVTSNTSTDNRKNSHRRSARIAVASQGPWLAIAVFCAEAIRQ